MVVAVLFAALALASSPPAAAACAVDEKSLLQLAPDKFDQDLDGGWRPLEQKAGCEAAAAKTNNARMKMCNG